MSTTQSAGDSEQPKKKQDNVDEASYRAAILYLWEHGKHFEAMKLLWRDKIVDCPPTRKLVKAMAHHRKLLILGHGSASKTFTAMAFKLMKWYLNPTKTGLALTSATIKSLGTRAWADLLLLHRDASVAMPGIPYRGIYEILYDKNDKKHKIMCLAGEDEGSVTKIQGFHPENLDLVIDEADNDYNMAIWKAIANLGTSGEFTVVGLANPIDRNSAFGMNCEPRDGWNSIDINSSFEWVSRTGYTVMRLDGLESPNVKSGHNIYPFLLTKRGVEDIIYEFGENSPNYLTYVRAWFPDTGSFNTFFTGDLVSRVEEQKIKFYGDSTPVAACDPSLGGGNRCVVTFGRAGVLASDPSKGCLVIDEIRYVQVKDPAVPVTNDFGKQIKELCMGHNVEPENFAIGAATVDIGLCDFISSDWSEKIVRIDPNGKASRSKILQEDSRLAEDRFDRRVTELWWAVREWAKAGQLQVGIAAMTRDLRIQLEARRWGNTKDNKLIAEKKDDMKKRGLKSPDEADSISYLLELVRKKFGELEATNLDHDPTLRRRAEQKQPETMPRELFEPQYKTDAVLGAREVNHHNEISDDEWNNSRYYGGDFS